MNIRRVILKFLCSILSSVLLLTSLAIPAQAQRQAQAQRRAIVVSAEQPNVWTLEQAHYLLAQMHRRNLDLRAKKLEDLDPNEINGLRFDILRQLVEFGATFNQADQFTNQILAKDKTANAERRRTLTAQRDKLHDESLDLTRQISQLKIEKAKATAQEEKDRLDAEIAAKTTEQEKVDKEIEFDDNELKTLGAGSGEFKGTTGGATFNAEKLPTSVFEKAFEDAMKQQLTEFNKEGPKLNATLRLENFLQMQYEIIAKQLSLLRDEVGPGERLLFLEIPQTVNVSHHEADNKWAQSWWKIAGYTWRCEVGNCAEVRRIKGMNAAENASPAQIGAADKQPSPSPSPSPSPEVSKPRQVQNRKPISTEDDYNSIFRGQAVIVEAATKSPNRWLTQFTNLDQVGTPVEELRDYLKTNKVELSNQMVRTVELIPRQSSLNVNDMKLRTRAGPLTSH